jgi:para-nitrobenzyl esterase
VAGSVRLAVWCSFVLSALLLVATASAGLTVQTTSGAVGGVLNGSTKEWRGVPYAAAPVGNLRWRPPAPASHWTGTRPATAFAQPCIQLDFPSGTFGSEDCLYLNVFVPAGASASAHLPVMVHLHPGSNSGFHPYEDASAFTSRGVIVVTVAYRLGVLGFVGHPALSAESGTSGEYGLLDQIAALKWVRDNIAAFGGDPANVTLFGSSAGTFDTVALVSSPLTHGLIARAAVQGEAFNALHGVPTIAEAEQLGFDLSQAFGCESTPNPLACLRAAPASLLVEGAGFLDLLPWTGGVVLPKSPLEVFTTRATVPLLIGFDREEDAVFFDPFDPSYGANDWVRDTNHLLGASLGPQVRALYPPSAYDSFLWSTITLATDTDRGCPTRLLANAAAARTPVWRWLYTHVYEDDDFFGTFRASHVLEDPFIWGSDVFGYGHAPTPAEQTLSARMTSYWANFAKTGNPNGPGLPAWPRYNTATESTLMLDDQIGVVNGYHREQCDLLDDVGALFPPPWWPGHGPPHDPPGFLYGHANGI